MSSRPQRNITDRQVRRAEALVEAADYLLQGFGRQLACLRQISDQGPCGFRFLRHGTLLTFGQFGKLTLHAKPGLFARPGFGRSFTGYASVSEEKSELPSLLRVAPPVVLPLRRTPLKCRLVVVKAMPPTT